MIRLLSCILIIAISAFNGCTEEIFSIDDYYAFLNTMSPIEIDFEYVELDELDGFTPLVQYEFDYAQEFNGNFTYIKYDDADYLLSRDGQFFYSQNLLLYKLVHDMYQVNSNGKFGLNGIFGNVILECKYFKIQTTQNSILAHNTKELVVYSKLGKHLKKNTFRKIDLHGDYILLDDQYYDLNFQELVTNDHRIFLPPQNDIAIIVKDNLLGYSYIDNGKMICPPKFRTAENFSFGRAITSSSSMDSEKLYDVIDLNGDIIYSSPMRLFSFNGKYTVFRDKDTDYYGVMDENYNIVTPAILKSSLQNRVFGDYVIDNFLECKFFSILDNRYIDTVYTEITPVGDTFIVKNRDGTFALFDASLNVIVDDCEKLFFDGEVLTLLKDEKYRFYKVK